MKNTVRIIGGQFRGRKLNFPTIDDLRPTPDRVKETLFNWLMNKIRDSRCLDAFAGSGSLGFEAFSRGAKEVIMIEYSKPVVINLQTIAQSLSPNAIQVLHRDARDFLQQTGTPFDIIFLDPPFNSDYLHECIALISKNQLLQPGGLLYIESFAKPSLDFNEWLERKSKQAGQVFYMLYEKR